MPNPGSTSVLKTRIITAIVLIAVVLAACFWLTRAGWIALVSGSLAIAAWEWGGLLHLGRGWRAVYVVAAAVLGLATIIGPLASLWPGRTPLYATASVFWIIFAPLWLWERPQFGTRAVPLAAGLLIIAAACAAMIEIREGHPGLVLALMMLVWISDSAAYFFGMRFGRHKLAPSISPGKTWEGVIGALAGVTLYGLIWFWLPGGLPSRNLALTPIGTLWFIALLLGLAAAGIIGDLFESQMKRQAGVKDSGKLFPGHGGMLDRIDSLLAVLPLAALVFDR